MKKTTMAVITLLVTMNSKADAEISGNLSTKLASEYIATNGFVLHNKAVQQTDLFILLPKGFYADLWVSMPWDSKENFGKEIDGTLGWNGTLGTTGLTTDIGVSYFDCINLSKSTGDIINPYAKISKDFAIMETQTLIPYVKIELPFTIGVADGKNGIYAYVGLKHVWQMTKKISFFHDIYVMHDSGAHGLERGWIGKYNMTINVQLNERFSFNPSLAIFAPLITFSDRKAEIVPAIGLTFSF